MELYVERILSEGLGLTSSGLEHAHQSIPRCLTQTNYLGISWYASYVHQPETGCYMANEKRGIEWEGHKLSFFEDLMRELAEKRKAI